jgi:membrane-associated protease RseP (regulator of RpoE activity)
MLNEPASTRDNRPVTRSSLPQPMRGDEQRNDLREKIATVLLIEKESFLDDSPQIERHSMMLESQLVASFEGVLMTDSESAYDQLDGLLAGSNQLAVFRETQPPKGEEVAPSRRHTIHVLTGRPNPKPRNSWLNIILFVATVFSVLLVGTNLAINGIASENLPLAQQLAARGILELWRGAPYAIAIILILGAHELGHYFAARRHKLAVTLPYFIPLPFLSPFGTMGAFIQLRQPMKNRKMLFDVGAAGPLAGLIFAVPILLIGLANSLPMPITGGGVYEGDSLLYAGAKILTYGHFVPDGRNDICVDCNQLLWAGWTGLLVTALNLIPIGQLDGGHVLYSLIGERARRLYYPAVAIMIGLVFIADVWLIWVFLLLLFGRLYATPLDMITPLDNQRRWLAVFTLIVFVLIFIPAPLSQQVAAPAPLEPLRNSAMVIPGLALLFSRLRP